METGDFHDEPQGVAPSALAGRITSGEVATALGVTPRQFQRLKQHVRVGGPLALRHQGRGQPSHRRLAAAVRVQVQALLQDRYPGFNDAHLTAKLREFHGLSISHESIRRLRLALGWPAVHRRRPAKHRARRPREAAAGQLVQFDGSPFAWLEDRDPTLTLLGTIDDASSEVLALHFGPTEDLDGYATILDAARATGRRAGSHSPRRCAKTLGIGYVRASSPQAKGRVERLWATL